MEHCRTVVLVKPADALPPWAILNSRCKNRSEYFSVLLVHLLNQRFQRNPWHFVLSLRINLPLCMNDPVFLMPAFLHTGYRKGNMIMLLMNNRMNNPGLIRRAHQHIWQSNLPQLYILPGKIIPACRLGHFEISHSRPYTIIVNAMLLQQPMFFAGQLRGVYSHSRCLDGTLARKRPRNIRRCSFIWPLCRPVPCFGKRIDRDPDSLYGLSGP
ncbi:hypothetical protein D3C73_982280 [compost metagenome]